MTDLYAVIGNPISQSKSPAIHAAFAASLGHDVEYRAIEAPLDGFRNSIEAFRAAGGLGLNVTAPFKLEAFELSTVRSQPVQRAEASNCLRFVDGRVEAENFDGVGLRIDIEDNLATPLAGRRVLILGAGGAARGILAPLLASNPAALMLANRSITKAVAIAELFSGVEPCALDGLGRHTGFDVVINATSAGLHGEAMALSASIFANGALAYDLSYGKGLTSFLYAAKSAGVERLHDGVGMVVEQAAESFAWWRGVRPTTRDIIAQLTKPLN
ncbi:MAG: shikimate dehydrogenase [Janthinobacterium lividum]